MSDTRTDACGMPNSDGVNCTLPYGHAGRCNWPSDTPEFDALVGVEYADAIEQIAAIARFGRQMERDRNRLRARYQADEDAVSKQFAQLRAELAAAIEALRVMNEDCVLAGMPGGDRYVTLANLRGLLKVLQATKAVVWFDWHDNDGDAVQAIDALREAYDRALARVKESNP